MDSDCTARIYFGSSATLYDISIGVDEEEGLKL
jgi:hypothetical protein